MECEGGKDAAHVHALPHKLPLLSGYSAVSCVAALLGCLCQQNQVLVGCLTATAAGSSLCLVRTAALSLGCNPFVLGEGLLLCWLQFGRLFRVSGRRCLQRLEAMACCRGSLCMCFRTACSVSLLVRQPVLLRNRCAVACFVCARRAWSADGADRAECQLLWACAVEAFVGMCCEGSASRSRSVVAVVEHLRCSGVQNPAACVCAW